MIWLQSTLCVKVKLENEAGGHRPGCGVWQVGTENMLDIDGSDWAL